jgi:hypothetical protein
MSHSIFIGSDEDLKKLFDRLVTDIIDAGDFLRLHKYFESAFTEYRNEIDETPAFWSLTEQAIRETSLNRLSRVYDQHPQSLSLLTLLHTIGKHPEFFEDAAVLKRVSAAYAEEFKPGSHKIDTAQLEKDIETVSTSDPLVEKVVKWRSNFGAHLSSKPILRASIKGWDGLTRDEAFELVERAFTIYNRYLVAFKAASYSSKSIGEEDHDFLFKILRIGLQKFRDDIEKQWR